MADSNSLKPSIYPEDGELHVAYLVIFILVILSLIYYIFIYEEPAYHKDEESKKWHETFQEYMSSSHNGLIRGIITGLILGDGLSSCIKSGATASLVNPLMTRLGY
jgi:di/tricarboxylate transporter